MPKKYSLNAAKPKLSEFVRPVVELRALESDPSDKTTAERHAEMDRAGLIHRVEGKTGQASFPLGLRRPGALRRFLEERG